jgi:hypothetical protein
MATNRIHHVEAIYRAHELWVGGLHRTRFRTSSRRVENYRTGLAGPNALSLRSENRDLLDSAATRAQN